MSAFRDGIADAVMNLLNRGLGTEFWVSTSVKSEGITTATFNLTEASSGGELIVEDIILKTDNTGLAGGATLQIVCNNTKGTSVIMQEGIPFLGPYRTASLQSTRHYQKGMDEGKGTARHNISPGTVLEAGKRVQVVSSGGACTGVGRVDFYIKFRRLSVNANIKVA